MRTLRHSRKIQKIFDNMVRRGLNFSARMLVAAFTQPDHYSARK
jgi:hypothetical protein